MFGGDKAQLTTWRALDRLRQLFILPQQVSTKQEQARNISSFLPSSSALDDDRDIISSEADYYKWDLSDMFLGDKALELLVDEICKEGRGIPVDEPVQPLPIEILLRGNKLKGRGAIALSRLLRRSSPVMTVNPFYQQLRIISLNLEWNSFGLYPVETSLLFQAIAQSSTLFKLDMRNNKLGPEAACELASLLEEHNSVLRVLDLRWNTVGDRGGRAFAESLARSCW